jgi:hypothetical protein
MAVFAIAASEAMGGEQEHISLALLNYNSSLNRCTFNDRRNRRVVDSMIAGHAPFTAAFRTKALSSRAVLIACQSCGANLLNDAASMRRHRSLTSVIALEGTYPILREIQFPPD